MPTNNPPQIWSAKLARSIIKVALGTLRKSRRSKKTALLSIWGGRGVGKTSLLDWIESNIKDSTQVPPIQRWNLEKDTIEKIRDAILVSIKTTEAGQPLVILLDNLDLLLRKDKDGSDFFDFERNVLLPAVEKGNAVFITTSQIELTQWREDEVRLCQESFQIPVLTRYEINAFFREKALDAKTVYTATFGHPKAITWLLEKPSLSAEVIAEQATTYFLEGLSAEAQKLARQTCLIPFFNPFLLREISQSDESGSDVLYLKHLDQIREFIGVGLIYWDPSIGAYRFINNSVRRLLARDVSNRDPKFFREVNEIAEKYYQVESRSAGYLQRHLVSAVYHLANSWLAQGEKDAGKFCLDWVRENIGNWVGAQWPDVLKMWVGGANDPAFVEEMKDLIGSEIFEEITYCLQTAQ